MPTLRGFGEGEEAAGVGGGLEGEGIRGFVAEAGEFVEGVAGVGGFVPFAAVRDGGEVGGIGLDEQTVGGNGPHDVSQRSRFLEGDHSREGEVEAEIEADASRLGRPGERVHDPIQRSDARGFPQDSEDFGFGFAAVDDEGKAGFAREGEMTAEVVDLDLERGVVPVAVEAGLADRDDAGSAGEFDDPVPVVGAGFAGVVGVDADGGEDIRGMSRGEVNREATRGDGRPDGDHRGDAFGDRAGDYFVAVDVEGGFVEVAVGVDDEVRHGRGAGRVTTKAQRHQGKAEDWGRETKEGMIE